MTISNLSEITEADLEKLLYIIDKANEGRSVTSISLTRTSQYKQERNEFILKTDKVYQDEFIKLTVSYA